MTDRDAEFVLIQHQRRDVQSCLCGWAKLGESHAMHQVDMLMQAAKKDGHDHVEIYRDPQKVNQR